MQRTNRHNPSALWKKRRLTQHLDEIAAKALFHFHGIPPAYVESMRNADADEWDSYSGNHRVQKNGDPRPVDGLGTGDGKARDFDGVDDSLSVPDASSLDLQDEDSFTFLTLLKELQTFKSSVTNFGLITKEVSGKGYEFWIRHNDPDRQIFARRRDGNGNSDLTAANVPNTPPDDLPKLAAATFDATNNSHNYWDGQFDTDGWNDLPNAITNAADLRVAGGQSFQHFPGVIALSGVHPQWTSQSQLDFLRDLLYGGNVAPGAFARLREFVYGHRRTGFKRRIPKYLTDTFGAGGPDFWWSADRHIRSIDGEGITQLTNHAGQTFPTQRTSSDKPIARGASTRGEPTQNLELSGVEYFEGKDFSSYQPFTYVLVGQQESGSGGDRQPVMRLTGGGQTLIRWLPGFGKFGYFIENDSGTNLSTNINLDPKNRHVFIISLDPNGDIYMTASESDGSVYNSTSTHLSGSFSQTRLWFPDSGGGAYGDWEAVGLERGVALSPSKCDQLRDDLDQRYNIS